jgi:hypothetical protein
MSPTEDTESAASATSLARRVEAAERFIDIAGQLVVVGELEWAAVDADYRLLAINSSLRRQLETLTAAVLLAKQDLGHLAVAFVRGSLEDLMYLTFFISLDLEDSQELFKLLGNWDALRSLLAQRDYVGDEVMEQLWYTRGFLDAAVQKRESVKEELRALRQRHNWSGGTLPSVDWIAERAGKRDLYDYLHAATSRALHFSAGEIMRRGWGHPHGRMATDKPEFREHLASFALDQLWRLFVETWASTAPLAEQAGIGSAQDLGWDQIEPVINQLTSLGKVPLVHAHEWNLTPYGPLSFTNPPGPEASGQS